MKSLQRATSSRWQETRQTVDNFVVSTDTTKYSQDIAATLAQVGAYVSAMRAQVYTDVGCSYQVQFGNISTPRLGAGAYRLPKQQFNGAMSTDEFTTPLLQSVLEGLVQSLQRLAEIQP